ncbi:hypothetical protein [Ochrovirga pacifica]|uniref:hypothetical protein n=1 Tax=Ochrovirga pacifica TaxID=1042376 RepID=UPI0002558E87|nr:hypothetical protein [Ochrovirga pacifica]
MNTVFELVTFDEKKTKYIKYLLSSLIPAFALTLILKRTENVTILIIGLIITLLILILTIVSFIFVKPYEKRGKITLNEEYLKIEENEKIMEFKLSEIEKMDVEYLTGKKGEKRPIITQYNRNSITLKDHQNNENIYSFLIENNISAKNIFKLESILNTKYNQIRIRNVYGQNG